uniref:Uncharacterized protein n=1 Tax=Panagrolaimus davidi TaxID=227884 RepID=A0A914PF29_9BILA
MLVDKDDGCTPRRLGYYCFGCQKIYRPYFAFDEHLEENSCCHTVEPLEIDITSYFPLNGSTVAPTIIPSIKISTYLCTQCQQSDFKSREEFHEHLFECARNPNFDTDEYITPTPTLSETNSVILLSDSEGEEKYLKIYYRGSQDCIEVPMEANGNVLFDDITSLDPKISALFLEKGSLKRLVKPTDGCIKEPKTKWRSFKVFAVLKKESEIILNGNSSDLNHDVKYDWNMRIKSETPTTTGSLQTGFEPDNPIAFPSPSNRITSIKSEPQTTSELRGNNNHEPEQPSSSRILTRKSETPTTTGSLQTGFDPDNPIAFLSPSNRIASIKSEPPTTSELRGNDNLEPEQPSSSRILTASQAKLSEILPTLNSVNQFVSADAVNTSFNSIVAVKFPTNAQLSSAYNVSRTKCLTYMLCRGNLGHYSNDYENI